MRSSKGSKKKIIADKLGFHFLHMIEHCSVHSFGMKDWIIGKLKKFFLYCPFHRKIIGKQTSTDPLEPLFFFSLHRTEANVCASLLLIKALKQPKVEHLRRLIPYD